MDDKKVIKYLNLTHPDFVKSLQDWSKIYFPKESKNLQNKASSGRHFIEVSSFIGDVLSFHMEDRFKNSNLKTATDPRAVVNLSEAHGYKFRGPSAARGPESFYLEVPAKTGSFGNDQPNMDYAFNFKNVQLQNNNGIFFEALEDVDFSETNTSSSAECLVSKRDQSSGRPTHYVLKKNVEVMAGRTVTETFVIASYKPFREIQLANKNVLDVISVKDSEGNEWFEVDFLAQEAIFEGVKNNGSDSANVPYMLKIKTVPRRFVKKVDPVTGQTRLIFGSGKGTEIGDSVVPDVSMLALDLKGKLIFSPSSIDPQNFLKTRSLGLAPYETTLTIQVRTGGGRISNTGEGSLTNIVSRAAVFNSGLVVSDLNNTLGSFTARNLAPIEGGDEAEDIDTIKKHAAAFFAAQSRINTKEDYIARSLSIPSKFGNVFRVYPVNNCDRNGGVQLYVLAKNKAGQVVAPSLDFKKNLRIYLSFFTRMGQGLDIIDGKIINIGIEYSILVESGMNKSKVKFETLLKVKEYFNINKWQLNQPIVIDEIFCLIKNTLGVVSIPELKVTNKNNEMNGVTYSSFAYDVKTNTRNKIVFGVPDGIFEVKFPDSHDIKVSAI